MRPILLNSCARAATAAEARFRIDRPIAPSRGVRVIALDPPAAAAVRRLATRSWSTARFFAPGAPGCLVRLGSDPPDAPAGNAGHDGERVSGLDAELADADVTVLVATSASGAGAAAGVGSACTVRGIMTAGLVLDTGQGRDDAVAILRPHARVLLVTTDEEDVAEVLQALRA